jgi:hypothetical protein
MLPSYLIYFTILISTTGYFFYLKNIIYGETKPNLVSWFMWMLAPFIGAFFQLKAGGGLAAIPVFLAGLGPLVVIFVSLFRKNSIWKITSIDIGCGIFSLLALVVYIFTHNISVAIIFAILSDALAGVPTIVKSWKFPKTETALVYCPGIINNIIVFLTIKEWNFSAYSFNAYLIIINLIIIFSIYHKKLAIFK